MFEYEEEIVDRNVFHETGEISFNDADDMNIPVDIWLDKDGDLFTLRAGNYMPRKGLVVECSYEAKSPNLKDLQTIIKDKILPLYENAKVKLSKMVEASTDEVSQDSLNLYYWG